MLAAHRFKAAVILALMVGVAGSLVPTASAQEAAPLKIGYVDLDAVSDQYQALLTRQQELRDWARAKAEYIAALNDFVFLSKENFDEVVAIYELQKATWTDAQKAREAELRAVAEGKEKLNLDLQAKAQRTAEEQDQFNSMQETISARRADINKLATQIEQEYLAKRSDAQMSLVTAVKGIIEKVSKDQGFDLVVDKALVFYAADNITDLTPAVLAELNKAQ
ncbi:MAG TPA: hypothetical protein DGT21_15635 [Armatimonadetes bacterium]|jgi:Skp family chaperone for outer membrane proteins|nr:hypothetical protein [Armatimonadota bacterium]